MYYNIELPLLFVLANIEQNGVKIDKDFLSKMSKSLTSKIKETEGLIFDISGEEFNVGSPKQLGAILFDKLKIQDNPKKTKSGQRGMSDPKKLSYLTLMMRYPLQLNLHYIHHTQF